MADIKISELPTADQANIDDLLEASQVDGAGYVTRHISLDQVATLVADSTQIADKVEGSEIDWSQIINEPATFPPTLPIAQGDVTNLVSDLALKAPLASPTFTGDPKAPTPATSDNDTSIATTAYTRLAIANFAPAPDLSAYALIASPTFTGDPKAPTPATADNDTSVATTAYVKANIAAIPAPPPSTTVSATSPGSPVDGQLWFFTDASVGGGTLYIRYNDGNTSQWVPASPGSSISMVLQTVSFQTGAVATGTTAIPVDDTIPQITEGNEYMTLAITPRSATSRLIIEVVCIIASSASGALAAALFQDATANALACAPANAAVNSQTTISFKHIMVSGTTSPTTFRVRAGANGGTTTFNGGAGARLYGGVMASSIVIQEVL